VGQISNPDYYLMLRETRFAIVFLPMVIDTIAFESFSSVSAIARPKITLASSIIKMCCNLERKIAVCDDTAKFEK